MRRTNCRLYVFGLILSYLSWPILCGTVYKTILREGKGDVPRVNQTVIVHYTGTLESGTKFDSSHDRFEPFKFKLGVGEVIRGWDAGVITMRVGERARLEIAPEDAYGVEGLPPVIPPSSKLLFDIELLGVEGGVAPPTVEVKNIPPSGPQTFPGSPQGQGFPPGQGFSSGRGQPFDSGNSQGQIFNPPDLPTLRGQGQGQIQGQEFRGSNIRQNEVVPRPQQTFGNLGQGQGQSFGSNPPQASQFPNSPPPGLTFASNQLQGGGQAGGSNSRQGQQFGGNPPPQSFGPPDSQGQSFGAGSNQGQSFSSPGTWRNPPAMPSQPPIGPGLSPSFPSSTGNSPSFGGQFPAPSQDISRMNPGLTQQGRPDPALSQPRRPDFQQFPSAGPQTPPGRSDQFGAAPPRRFSDRQSGLPRGPSQAQSNSFGPPADVNSFTQRRFGPSMPVGSPQGTGTGGRVPDLDTVRSQSVDLRPRFPGDTDRQPSFGSIPPRDVLRPSGRDFPPAGGLPSSMFDRPPTTDLSSPRLADRMGRTRMDATGFRGEVGLDPAFPEMFSRRDFRTGTRGVGGRPPADLFGSRAGATFGAGTRRFPEIDPRAMRGFPPGRFGRPRDPMTMMMDRARRARMMRGF